MRVNITGTKNKVEGCHTQTTDYGTREWSILLSALAKPKRHRKHADDHGARGHDDGPQPGEPGGDRSLKRRFTLGAKIIRKGHEQDRIGCRHADRHDCSHQGWDIECGLS